MMSERLVVTGSRTSVSDEIIMTRTSSGRTQIPHLFLDLVSDTRPPQNAEGGGFVRRVTSKPVLHPLPLLSIPISVRGRTASPSDSPETPASLSSPIVGVVDLTRNIRTVSSSSVAAGGFSDIYEGEWERRHEGPDEVLQWTETVQVAIKLLRVLASKDQDGLKARKRLNREVYVWHRLKHPNIAEFFGTSYHMGARPAMVMRWYKHGNAAEYLRVKNPDADRAALILDAARGLNYLHTLKPAPIVHGDLKGNNILITDEGRAALSDFGLSQVIEELVGPTGYTPSNAEVGPLRWQSPEFLEDENSRPTLLSDTWSFGCTAYELLVDKIPYHHRTRDYMVMKDIQSGVKPPGPDEMLLSEVQGNIWNVLQQCWSFAPANRPTMAEVISQLEVCNSRDDIF